MGGLLSEEAKQKCREKSTGVVFTKERLEKMRIASTGKTPLNAKPVVGVNIKTGEIIELDHAYADERFHYNCIHRCAKGERQHHKGYRWFYKQCGQANKV